MGVPKDPIMLLSYINTQLRDFYPNPEELCADLDLDWEELVQRLSAIGYHYEAEQKRFV